LDPVLLADFIHAPYRHFLDIGCGTGPYPSCCWPATRRQPGWGLRSSRGCRPGSASGGSKWIGARFSLAAADVREAGLVPRAAFDLVASIAVPALGKGVLPPQAERSLAHHEVALT